MFNNLFSEGEKDPRPPWFVMIADFCGRNANTVTDLKLPRWGHWVELGRDAHSQLMPAGARGPQHAPGGVGITESLISIPSWFEGGMK